MSHDPVNREDWHICQGHRSAVQPSPVIRAAGTQRRIRITVNFDVYCPCLYCKPVSLKPWPWTPHFYLVFYLLVKESQLETYSKFDGQCLPLVIHPVQNSAEFKCKKYASGSPAILMSMLPFSVPFKINGLLSFATSGM